jgi:hypothetical protein
MGHPILEVTLVCSFLLHYGPSEPMDVVIGDWGGGGVSLRHTFSPETCDHTHVLHAPLFEMNLRK